MLHALKIANYSDSAEGLFHAAEFSHALTLIDSWPDTVYATTFAAKCLMRMRKPSDAYLILKPWCDDGTAGPVGYAIAAYAAAQVAPNDVERLLSRVGDLRSLEPVTRSEASLFAATACIASKHVDRGLEIVNAHAFADRSANSILCGRLLYAFVLGTQGKYAEQAKLLRLAADRSAGHNVEEYLKINLLCNLAVVSCEIPSAVPAKQLKVLYESIRWPSDPMMQRYYAMDSLAWRYAQEGGYIGAHRMARAARRIAPSPANAIMSSFSIVNFLRWGGEITSASGELEDALDALEKIDPTSIIGDERLVFVLAAEAVVSSSPTAAARWLSVFDQTRDSSLDNYAGGSHDRRYEAMGDFARGLVAQRMNDFEVAETHLKSAFDLFILHDYDYRAARAASALHHLTRDGKWDDIARKLLGNLPMTFAERQEAVEQPPGFAKLTRAEREVYPLMMERFTAPEIAERLGKKRTTVDKQIVSVRKKLGAKRVRDLW